jgi:hypothetical protein
MLSNISQSLNSIFTTCVPYLKNYFYRPLGLHGTVQYAQYFTGPPYYGWESRGGGRVSSSMMWGTRYLVPVDSLPGPVD